MSIKQRMKEYLKAKGIGEGKFEKKSGLSNGYITKIGASIGTAKLDLIKKSAPDLNIDWLIHGEGEMLTDNINNPDTDMKQNSQLKTMEKLVKSLEKQVELLEKENQRLSIELDKSTEANQDFINE